MKVGLFRPVSDTEVIVSMNKSSQRWWMCTSDVGRPISENRKYSFGIIIKILLFKMTLHLMYVKQKNRKSKVTSFNQ